MATDAWTKLSTPTATIVAALIGAVVGGVGGALVGGKKHRVLGVMIGAGGVGVAGGVAGYVAATMGAKLDAGGRTLNKGSSSKTPPPTSCPAGQVLRGDPPMCVDANLDVQYNQPGGTTPASYPDPGGYSNPTTPGTLDPVLTDPGDPSSLDPFSSVIMRNGKPVARRPMVQGRVVSSRRVK